jgi:hypothetical protein
MRIPVGNFGNAVPQPGPAIAVPQQAFGDSRGLIQMGRAIVGVSDVLYEREAIQDATSIINSAKQKLHEFKLKVDNDPGSDTGTPRYATMEKDFEAFAKRIGDDAQKATNNRKAQDVINRTLSGYIESTREHVMTQAERRRQDAFAAKTLADIDYYKSASGLSDEERAIGIDQTLGAAIASGSMKQEEAYKVQRKTAEDMTANKYISALEAATSPAQIADVQKTIANDPSLSPEKKLSMSSAASTRRTQLEKDTETAVKQEQDGILKTLTDLRTGGLLTPQMVEKFRSKLTAEQYETQMSRLRNQAVEGADDPKTVQELTSEIRNAWKDPVKLQRLRDRVTVYGSGYDPATRTTGSPRISRRTEDQFNATIEGYLNDLRAEGQRQKTDAEQAADKQFDTVRGIIVQKLQVQKSAAGKDDKAQVEKLESDVLEELARNRKDPNAYLERLRKERPNLFKPPVPSELKFYVQPKGNSAPDWDDAAKRMYGDYKRGFDKATDPKRKQSLTDQWLKDYDNLKRFRREWDAAQ